MILDEKQRERAKGSKYMQSKPGDIYQEAYHWLMDNPKKELLFVGMGCQSDGFRKFSEIKGIRDRVYIVDIICHGLSKSETVERICRINTKEGWKDNLSYLQRQAQWLEITYSLCESQRVRETA